MKIKIIERKKKKDCFDHKTWDQKEDCLVSKGYSREVAKKILGSAKAKGQIDETAYPISLSETELKDRFKAIFSTAGIHVDKIADVFNEALKEHKKESEPWPYGANSPKMNEGK